MRTRIRTMAMSSSLYELTLRALVGYLVGFNAWIHVEAIGHSHDANAKGTSVIIIGAGIAGITAGKHLAKNGVDDIIILEGQSIIGGRIQTHEFAGLTIEKGANWVEGVGGPEVNPILTLAQKVHLRNKASDYSNTSSNIYTQEGLLPPQKGEAALNLSDTTFVFDEDLGANLSARKQMDISILTAQRFFGRVPETPVEMALDYFNYDYEFAEPPRVTSLKNTQPLPTFENFGDQINFVSDKRGYGTIVYYLASQYLKTEGGKINDPRLKLNKVVRTIKYSSKGVTLTTEDGDMYTADNVIITVSLGVLQSNLLGFQPDLPGWKLTAIYQFDMATYTKIFIKFPYKFWPTGPGTEFWLYADERRGYYPIWQHLENEFPGSNTIFVTVTDDESIRIEQQPDKQTIDEIMVVLQNMFKICVPTAVDIYIPRWRKDRLFRGSFSNWPIGVNAKTFRQLQASVERLHFSGEHTSEHYNGYVHGGYFSGIEAADRLLKLRGKQ